MLGYSYSASTDKRNGIALDFDVSHLHPGNANARACGLQLRCLSE
ncbi:hypothetical protein [uncultured Rikenella sp.]|nr:hypothetical protein [uncultured Rikenella sp.]